MDKKPTDKEINSAVDAHLKQLESEGMIRTGKHRNKSKDAPIEITSEKVIAARNRYLGEKNLHEWKREHFIIGRFDPFVYDYEKDGIINSDLFKKAQASNV